MRTFLSVLIVCVAGFGCCHQRHDPATRPTASDAVATKSRALNDPFNKVEERRVSYTEKIKAQEKAAATAAALKQPLEDVSFSGTLLSNAIETLRNKSKLTIFVNWRAMEHAGMKQDLPVTCSLQGLTIQDGLLKLLDEVGSERVGLGYEIDEDVITVSTKDDLSLNAVTRVYDIRDGVTAKDPVERQKQVDRIMRVVYGIRPLSWREQGGHVGAVRELSGQLIVTATPQTQKRVMEELEKFNSGKAPPLMSLRRD